MNKNIKILKWSFTYKLLYILAVVGICINLTSCSEHKSDQSPQTVKMSSSGIKTYKTESYKSDSNNITIKGLVLKYVLIDTAYEVYQVNIEKEKYYSYASYSCAGGDSKNHYKWLTDTFNSMNAKNKDYLKVIFRSGIHEWKFMDILTKLEDEANADDIVQALTSDVDVNKNDKLKAAITNFLPYFYSNYMKSYLEESKVTFNSYVEKINNQINKKNPDIIDFMEQVSGIKFKTKYRPVFYYTLRPIGAMGFEYQDQKISTLERTCTDYMYLLGTPFHEFSHELFRTFTNDRDFLEVTELLKKNKALHDEWLSRMKNDYSWEEWCEENLVEGFSKYLSYKYYNSDNYNQTYLYDFDFYKYLKEKTFDGQKNSLKEICIEFYKTKCD